MSVIANNFSSVCLYNQGVTKNDTLQNCFTAYVHRSLHRERIKYVKKTTAQHFVEIPISDFSDLSTEDAYTFPNSVDDLFFEHSVELETLDNKKLSYAILKLSDRDRKILFLHVLDGYKHAEIANMLRLSSAAVQKAYWRSIKYLRCNMEEKYRGI
ncbi:MAG: Sigma-70, region 4 [Oscillospiraceae bacterium]|jgi:RNA polymerase sigma factor (sigma-70 family)|nr:Sigma-70, region 4 [Oscillospiraceae bacterium]